MILDAFFPKRCPSCDRVWNKGRTELCPYCVEKIRYVKEPRCVKCSKKLNHSEAVYCYDCAYKKHDYESGMALYEYQSVREAIYRFKYEGRQEYAEFWGRDIVGHFENLFQEWKCDALIPVPLHKSKMQSRGYNQSELLANEVGKLLHIQVCNDLVIRCRETKAQKNLNDMERQNNLKKAFIIKENDVKLDTTVIIDDIYTTGSTIDAISRELLRCGVKKIHFITLAIGRGL